MNSPNIVEPNSQICHCCEKPFTDAKPATNLCLFAERTLEVGFGLLHRECAETYFNCAAYTWSLNDSSVVRRDEPLPKSKGKRR